MPDTQPDPVTVICRTPGCFNANKPIEIMDHYFDEETGTWVEVGSIGCGVCGADLSPEPAEG